MEERKITIGEAVFEVSNQIAARVIAQSFNEGSYIEMYGDVNKKFNRWGMIWPIGGLDPNTLETYMQESKTRPLREVVAWHMVKEANAIWAEKKPQGYGKEVGFSRSILDLAINDGYLRVGRAILEPGIAAGSFEIDPTGVDLLYAVLESLALFESSDQKNIRDFDTPRDPAVMGMQAGIERYQNLYDELVRKGAKKDELKK